MAEPDPSPDVAEPIPVVAVPALPAHPTVEEYVDHVVHWTSRIVDDLRDHAEPFDTEGFDRTVQEMIGRTRDPELVSALWDYREGKTRPHDLMRLPAFRAERQRWFEEIAERHRQQQR